MSMTSELFIQIASALITVIGAVIAYYFVPFLKAKLGAANYLNALSWAKIAVQAAEQIFQESGQGLNKKVYVLEFLKNKGIHLTPDELDALIESAVLELNRAVKS